MAILFYRGFKGRTDGLVDAHDQLGGELFHAIIGKDAVDLILNVGELGIDGGRKPLTEDRGDHLGQIKPLVGGRERLGP